LWPSFKYCFTDGVDYSAKFETEKHSFSGSASQKSEITAFEIRGSSQLDFIPLDILTEFPNLNGMIVYGSLLPVVRSGLFKTELQKIEYLHLGGNKIETIEANAFYYMIKLKWISLSWNSLKTLSDQLFKNNPDLIYIGLYDNQITSIHPDFFDGLEKLKLIEFRWNECFNGEIRCETCLIGQAELKKKLQECFDNCLKGTVCHDSYSAHESN
jgi:hypothetical protein